MVSPELLRRYPFFAILDDAQLKAIAMLADEVCYRKGEILFKADQPADTFYFLIEGAVDLYYIITDADNAELHKEFFVTELNPGEAFGISALIAPYRYAGTMKVRADSRVLRVDASGLRALCEVDSRIAANLMREVARVALSRLHNTQVQLAAARA